MNGLKNFRLEDCGNSSIEQVLNKFFIAPPTWSPGLVEEKIIVVDVEGKAKDFRAEAQAGIHDPRIRFYYDKDKKQFFSAGTVINGKSTEEDLFRSLPVKKICEHFRNSYTDCQKD